MKKNVSLSVSIGITPVATADPFKYKVALLPWVVTARLYHCPLVMDGPAISEPHCE